MAYDLTKTAIKAFNRTYGTDISLSKIQSEAKRLNSFNDAFRAEFLKAYKQVVFKELIHKNGSYYQSGNMLLDFKRDIVNRFISETPRSRRGDPSKNMGLKTKEEAYNMLMAVQAELPQNQVDAVAENYLKGNIRIRDMVASKFELVSKNDQRKFELASYAAALKKVNESRPLWWRIIHPFRNNAEQREARLIEDILKKEYGNLATIASTNVNNTLINASQIKKETEDHVLKNNDIIEDEINYQELDKQIEEDFNGLEFDGDLTKEEKERYFQNYRARRIQEAEDEEFYKAQEEVLKMLNIGPGRNKQNEEESKESSAGVDNIENNNNDPIINNEQNKDPMKINECEENIYSGSVSGQISEDSKIIKDISISNH